MNQSTLSKALEQIISEHGTDILRNGNRVIAMLSDYLPDGSAEKNKLRIAYEFNVVQMLAKIQNNTEDASVACNKAIEVLKNRGFIESEIADSIVCDIADALRLKYSLANGSEDKVQRPVSAVKDTAKVKKTVRRENRSDDSNMQKTFQRRAAYPAYGAGYGIHSTHNNPIVPYQVYDDLESQQNLDLTLSDKIAHPINAFISALRMSSKYNIAYEWERAQMYCNVYDAYVLDGGGHSPWAVKYKKYNEKYIKKLERKFWS